MPALAFVLALIIGGIVIGLTDSRVNSQIGHPVKFIKSLLSTVGNAYLSLFQGAIYDPHLATGKGFFYGFYPFSESLLAAAPLILCGLAVAVAFKSGLFNIGAQGQFIFGAIGASFIGFHYQLPFGVHILIAVAFGILLAAVFGGIAGFLKAKTGAHEVIVTIMLNYVATSFFTYLLREPNLLLEASYALLKEFHTSTLRCYLGLCIFSFPLKPFFHPVTMVLITDFGEEVVDNCLGTS